MRRGEIEERRAAFKRAQDQEGPQGPIHHHRQPSAWVEGGLALLLIAFAVFADALANWLF